MQEASSHTENPPADLRANVLLVAAPPDRRALEEILAEAGHNLVPAGSAEEALQLLSEGDFAVILLAVQMPALDGFATARLIRNREHARHTPIIFLAEGGDSHLPLEQAYALGAVDYLAKPLVPIILRAKVAGFVELAHKTERLRQMERREFERKLAEENARLRDSEERFARFMQHLPGLAWIKDLQGRYVYANDAALKAFRTCRADLYGKTDEEVFPPSTAAQFKENDWQALASGAGVQVVETLLHEDGILHHSLVSKFPVPGPDGRVAFVGGMAIDITEQKQTQAVLEESELRFRQLAENIREVFWMSDPQKSQVLYISPAYEEVWGRSCQSLYDEPRSFLDAVHPEDRDRVITTSLARQGRGELTDVEYRLVRPDGSVRWVRDRSFPVADDSGRIYRMAGIAEDITEGKLAEESLRASERLFKALASHAPVGIFQTDAQGNGLFVNERWCEMAGLAPEQARGQGWAEALHPDDRDRIFQEWYAAAREGREFAGEYRFRTPGGKVTWLAGSAVALRDEAGEVSGYIGTVTDITDRKETEESLKAADARKDEWLAMLAHELRNPLAPIRNAVEVMRLLGPADPELARCRDMIERQTKHLTRLVGDLLDVSRITRGKVTLQKERLDLGRLTREAVEDCRPTFAQAGVGLVLDLPEVPLWVEGDPTRLTQVLDNLLQNACKFTAGVAQGQVSVRVEDDEGWGEIRVRDTGVGIEPEMLPRLFDTFSQADRSLDRSKGGLGLGLALVKGLVQLHGGDVQASSAGPGRGAEFVVRLPRQAEPAALTEIRGPAHPQPRAQRLRILVVEDSPDAAESLRVLLELFGHEVELASTGPEGLQKAIQWRPDVVLCDIGLPGLDGYGVAGALRRSHAAGNHRPLLIALTGYGTDEDRARSRQAGFDQHLVKPVDPEVLQEILARR